MSKKKYELDIWILSRRRGAPYTQIQANFTVFKPTLEVRLVFEGALFSKNDGSD